MLGGNPMLHGNLPDLSQCSNLKCLELYANAEWATNGNVRSGVYGWDANCYGGGGDGDDGGDSWFVPYYTSGTSLGGQLFDLSRMNSLTYLNIAQNKNIRGTIMLNPPFLSFIFTGFLVV